MGSMKVGCDLVKYYPVDPEALLTLFSRPKNNPVNVDVGYFWTPNSMQYTENLTREIQILVPIMFCVSWENGLCLG